VAAILVGGSLAHAGERPVRDETVAQLAARLTETYAGMDGATDDAREVLDAQAESIRARLLAAGPDDDRAATWLLDSAAHVLAQLSRTGDDASVLLGIPTRKQRDHVALCADRAMGLITRASGAAASAIPRLEARLLEPGLTLQRAREVEVEIEPLLSRLVDVEVAQRLPAMRLRASVLVAAQGGGGGGDAAPRSAAQELVSKSALHGDGAEARKRLFSSVLLLASDDPRQLEAARRQLDWLVPTAPADGQQGKTQATESLSPAELVMLHMALVRCGREEASLQLPCPGRGQDWLVDLLLAESAARAADGPGLNSALKQMLAIVTKYGGSESGLDSPEALSPLRLLMYEKVGSEVDAAATSGRAAWERLDPEALLAYALTRSEGTTRVEATALLAKVVERSDAPAPIKARALWALAEVSAEAPAEQGGRVSPHLIRLVRELPETRLALTGAKRIVGSVPAVRWDEEPCAHDGLGTLPTEGTLPLADIAAALRVILRADPADDESAGKLIACLLAGSNAAPAPALVEAVALHRRLPDSSADRPRIQACITHSFDRAINSPLDARARDLLLRAAAEWFGQLGNEGSARALELRLDRAEAALAAGLEPPDRTVADLQALLGSEVDVPGTVDRARLRVAIGAAQRCAGDTEPAFAMLRSVAEEFEGDARAMAPARRRAKQAFWSAWAELIEMLAKQERDGRAGGGESELQTTRQRERLELLDPGLGGEPWAGRIRAASGGKAK